MPPYIHGGSETPLLLLENTVVPVYVMPSSLSTKTGALHGREELSGSGTRETRKRTEATYKYFIGAQPAQQAHDECMHNFPIYQKNMGQFSTRAP